MHLVETYALSTGSKIKKPFIFENFFPLVFDKYITFQAQTKYDSKDYAYWQSVINLIFPVLEKHNIKIVQIGNPNEWAYQYALDLRGRTDFHQLAYVVHHSMLHMGSDSLGVHLASTFDIPIVSLYSVSQADVSGPYFGNPNKHVLFDAFKRTRNGKPSYAAQEAPKCINLIRPEEIANSIFLLLKIEDRVKYETVHMGEKYGSKMIREFIPLKSFPFDTPQIPIEVRMDLDFNEKVLVEQLSKTKCIIITNKNINKNILAQFKPNIAALIYDVTDDDDPSFIDSIKDLGLQIVLISSLSLDKIIKKRINYYELGKINQLTFESEEIVNNLKKDFDKLYFRSNKLVYCNDKVYMGNANRLNNQEAIDDFNFHKAVDCPEFWKELQFCHVVKKLD